MKGMLSAWQANHDIQFVLNVYICIIYICDYMTKAQKGMSDLLATACREAREGKYDTEKKAFNTWATSF